MIDDNHLCSLLRQNYRLKLKAVDAIERKLAQPGWKVSLKGEGPEFRLFATNEASGHRVTSDPGDVRGDDVVVTMTRQLNQEIRKLNSNAMSVTSAVYPRDNPPPSIEEVIREIERLGWTPVVEHVYFMLEAHAKRDGEETTHFFEDHRPDKDDATVKALLNVLAEISQPNV